jgi:hypothetical protein
VKQLPQLIILDHCVFAIFVLLEVNGGRDTTLYSTLDWESLQAACLQVAQQMRDDHMVVFVCSLHSQGRVKLSTQ